MNYVASLARVNLDKATSEIVEVETRGSEKISWRRRPEDRHPLADGPWSYPVFVETVSLEKKISVMAPNSPRASVSQCRFHTGPDDPWNVIEKI